MFRPLAHNALAVLSLAAICQAGPAQAQTRDENWKHCPDANPDLTIAACTAIMQSGQESTENLASAFNNRGVAYDDKGQFDLAITDYNQAIRLEPNSADAFNNRGNAYNRKGQLDLAIADYNQAIRLEPNLATAFSNRGAAYHSQGQEDLAIADCNQAILLMPDFADAYNNRGNAHRRKGEYDLAIADYSQAILLKPDLAQAIFNRGFSYDAKDQFELGIADYDQDLRLRPNHGEGWNNRCWDRAILGQLVQALEDCNHALQLQPKDAKTLDSRGFTFLKLGRFDLAIIDYDAALALDPKLAVSLYGRGLAERTSDAVKARTDITAALAIDAQVAGNFRKWGVILALPAGLPESVTVPATLAGEILDALEKQPEYLTITGLYDRNKSNAAWMQSEQGQTVRMLERLMRTDAVVIAVIPETGGPVLQYSVGGVKQSDANIRVADLASDAAYRHAIAGLIAQSICQSAQVHGILSKLSAGTGTK